MWKTRRLWQANSAGHRDWHLKPVAMATCREAPAGISSYQEIVPAGCMSREKATRVLVASKVVPQVDHGPLEPPPIAPLLDFIFGDAGQESIRNDAVTRVDGAMPSGMRPACCGASTRKEQLAGGVSPWGLPGESFRTLPWFHQIRRNEVESGVILPCWRHWCV